MIHFPVSIHHLAHFGLLAGGCYSLYIGVSEKNPYAIAGGVGALFGAFLSNKTAYDNYKATAEINLGTSMLKKQLALEKKEPADSLERLASMGSFPCGGFNEEGEPFLKKPITAIRTFNNAGETLALECFFFDKGNCLASADMDTECPFAPKQLPTPNQWSGS